MTPLQLTAEEFDACRIKPVWVIMPILAHRDYTIAAIGDVLQQSASVMVLLVNQGVEDGFRAELERIAEANPNVLLWSHMPPLPSLSATWNRALDCAWEAGAEQALVVNNDVRLHLDTVLVLRSELRRQDALFVSAVGVTAEQFDPAQPLAFSETHGGPDFSCFLLSAECHARFRFDEHFIPAFCEDLDYHRRLMLAGEGARIFSVNLPYLHYASATLKALPEKEAARVRRQIETGSRAYYARCWGGPVNQERFVIKSDPASAQDGVTTPELQARVMAGQPAASGDSALASTVGATEERTKPA